MYQNRFIACGVASAGMATLPSGRMMGTEDPCETAAAMTIARRRQTAAGALEEEDIPPFFCWLSEPVEVCGGIGA